MFVWYKFVVAFYGTRPGLQRIVLPSPISFAGCAIGVSRDWIFVESHLMPQCRSMTTSPMWSSGHATFIFDPFGTFV